MINEATLVIRNNVRLVTFALDLLRMKLGTIDSILFVTSDILKMLVKVNGKNGGDNYR